MGHHHLVSSLGRKTLVVSGRLFCVLGLKCTGSCTLWSHEITLTALYWIGMLWGFFKSSLSKQVVSVSMELFWSWVGLFWTTLLVILVY